MLKKFSRRLLHPDDAEQMLSNVILSGNLYDSLETVRSIAGGVNGCSKRQDGVVRSGHPVDSRIAKSSIMSRLCMTRGHYIFTSCVRIVMIPCMEEGKQILPAAPTASKVVARAGKVLTTFPVALTPYG